MTDNYRNESLNKTVRYPTVSQLLEMIGSYGLVDSLAMYVNTPIAALGSILNLLCIVVYMSNQFQLPLYKYLRVYCYNSLAICLISVFLFVVGSPRLFTPGQSYSGMAYYVYGYLSVGNIFYVNATIIDIFISLERISYLNLKLKARVGSLSPYKMCLIGFIASCLIDIVFFINYEPRSFTVPIGPGELYTVWYLSLSDFGSSTIGRVFLYINNFIRDILLVGTLIVINIFLVIHMRAYFKKKHSFRQPAQYNSRTDSINRQPVASTSVGVISTGGHPTERKLVLAQLKLTIMVIIIVLLAVYKHLMTLLISFYVLFTGDTVSEQIRMFVFVDSLANTINHTANFFLFFIFNETFRKEALYLIQLDDDDVD